MNYCNSYFNYTRRQTITVTIGQLPMGGNYPIRIQTMANTNTNEIEASLKQAIRTLKAGTELLRYTTQGVKEAENLGLIHTALKQQGIELPLVADVHFNPKVAEVAATLVEKVRINPGNFVNSLTSDYSDEAYQEELDRIEQKLIPLLDICQEHHTALRIGVNHGSLSPRIVSRYGDTPQGLAASCIEFIELCTKHHFTHLVISVKASNTLVMVQAVRLLVSKMKEINTPLPLHLGVTEAGNGEDGRIKSAVGIGALLADGIGDTIRVSLSEDPEYEIPVAKLLAQYINQRQNHPHIQAPTYSDFSPYTYTRRLSHSVGKVGGNNPAVVLANQSTTTEPLADIILPKESSLFWPITLAELDHKTLEKLKNEPQHILLLSSSHQNPVGEMRAFLHTLMQQHLTHPVVLCRDYTDQTLEEIQIKASADLGALLLDGFADGIMISNTSKSVTQEQLNSLAFGILQASRVRMSRTEYISCPGCGRTQFDLQNVVNQVKAATSHLKHLKIAVMGCIVNGPGEMADADYGYVGAGKGKISLYRKQECIEKNIPQEKAIERLLDIIEKETR